MQEHRGQTQLCETEAQIASLEVSKLHEKYRSTPIDKDKNRQELYDAALKILSDENTDINEKVKILCHNNEITKVAAHYPSQTGSSENTKLIEIIVEIAKEWPSIRTTQSDGSVYHSDTTKLVTDQPEIIELAINASYNGHHKLADAVATLLNQLEPTKAIELITKVPEVIYMAATKGSGYLYSQEINQDLKKLKEIEESYPITLPGHKKKSEKEPQEYCAQLENHIRAIEKPLENFLEKSNSLVFAIAKIIKRALSAKEQCLHDSASLKKIFNQFYKIEDYSHQKYIVNTDAVKDPMLKEILQGRIKLLNNMLNLGVKNLSFGVIHKVINFCGKTHLLEHAKTQMDANKEQKTEGLYKSNGGNLEGHINDARQIEAEEKTECAGCFSIFFSGPKQAQTTNPTTLSNHGS